MFPELIGQIGVENQTSQMMTSLVAVAGYSMIGPGAPELSLSTQSSVLRAVLPWLSHPSSFVRAATQLLAHHLLPTQLAMMDGAGVSGASSVVRGGAGGEKHDGQAAGNAEAESVAVEASDAVRDMEYLGIVWQYLERNRDCIKLRNKQRKLFTCLDPSAEATVERMLIHSNELKEIAPQSLVELVQENMQVRRGDWCS